jgi:carbon starvation protein
MTTMDTALRLTRYVTQEFFAGDRTVQEAKADGNIMCNNVVCMLIALALCAFIAFMGYLKIWTLFGTSNQMVSALALMGIVLWLRCIGKKYAMCLIPMWWMIIVGTCSCIYVIYSNWGTNWAVTIIAILLLRAADFLYKQVFSALRNKQEAQEVAMEK